MNGGEVTARAPKPVPQPKIKPKPLAKPPVPRHASTSNLPIKPKPPVPRHASTSSIPSPKPLITSPKPKVDAVPQPSPKPPIVSPRPRKESLPKETDDASPPTPTLTNGGVLRPGSSKPKPNVKRKSWLPSPQQSFDFLPVTKGAAPSPKQNQEPAGLSELEQKLLRKREWENAIDPSETLLVGVSQIVVGKRADDAVPAHVSTYANESVVSITKVTGEPERVDHKTQPCQIAEIDRTGSSVQELDSDAPSTCTLPSNDDTSVTPSVTPAEVALKDQSQSATTEITEKPLAEDIPVETIHHEVRDLKQSESIEWAKESSTSEDNPVTPEFTQIQDVAEEPTSDVDISQDSTATESIGTLGGSPESLPDQGDSGTESAPCEQSLPASRVPSDVADVPKKVKPLPPPRTSISSIASSTSSTEDSYDLLNSNKYGSSFKSTRSSHSVRSNASSRLGSDSEDEFGVFTVNENREDFEELEEIGEEEEGAEAEVVTRLLPGEREESAGPVQAKPTSHVIAFSDLQEKEGLIAESEEDIVLVEAVTLSQRSNASDENKVLAEQEDIPKREEVHSTEQLKPESVDVAEDDIPHSNRDCVAEHVDPVSVSLEDDPPLNDEIDETESKVHEVVSDVAADDSSLDVQLSTARISKEDNDIAHVEDGSGHYLNEQVEDAHQEELSIGVRSEAQESFLEASQDQQEILSESEKEDREKVATVDQVEQDIEDQQSTGESREGAESREGLQELQREEEGEVDEMGKRVFSFSKKKKQGPLKYSSGEFHEQYEASGKDKAQGNSKTKDNKKKHKKGKKDGQEQKQEVQEIKSNNEVPESPDMSPDDEDIPTKPPRTRPGATAEELEVGRASTTSDASTNPVADGEELMPRRKTPAQRVSLSRPRGRPKISLAHRRSSVDSDMEDNLSFGADADPHSDQEVVNGGAGPVTTYIDSDGEEEVFIGMGGRDSNYSEPEVFTPMHAAVSASCTQTMFADQASINSSSADASMVDESTEVQALSSGYERQFQHFATIEPVSQGADVGASTVARATTDPSSHHADTLTTLSENQSVSISITESEPLSDSNEFQAQAPECAIRKPWAEVAAVTVAMGTMPEPLVPELTQIEADSSTNTSASSLVASQPAAQEAGSVGMAQAAANSDDEDDDEEEDEEEHERVMSLGNMYDKINIYDESYKKGDWVRRETPEEVAALLLQVVRDEEAAEEKDAVSELSSSSSLATTASEKEFRSAYGEKAHRIQRRRGSEDYVRLSRISRERTITLSRQDGTFGLRIQKSKPVVITSLDPGGAAEMAGLKVRDMILSINGQDVRQKRHSEVVKLATEAPEPLTLVVGTMALNSVNVEGDAVGMSGFMHKLASSGMIKQWRRRWFVLKQDNCLYYYKTQNDVVPQGAIVLQNYIVTKARDAGKQFSFKLTKEGARTYYFYTANEEEMSSWGKALSEAASPRHTADVWMDISMHNVGLPALSIKDPECQGFLTKWNGKMKNPKRRYCVLKDACFYYYKDMNDMSAQGVVHLHGYTLQETELKGKKFAFVLKPPEETLREFFFAADHETDRKRWVAALAGSIGRWIPVNAADEGEDDGTEMFI